MKQVLNDDKYSLISPQDKTFIIAFDEAMRRSGYESGKVIGNGYCWGRYMIIYARAGVKSRQVSARIYIRDHDIALRLFLNQIDRHRTYIEQAPDFIKEPFTGSHGDCHHCKNQQGPTCRFRKTFTLDNRLIEKCNGEVFVFPRPSVERLPEYLALHREFFVLHCRSHQLE